MQQHPPTPAAGAALRLRRAVTTDHAALAELWKRSVVATHHFLTPQAVDELYAAILQEYLPGVEELWLAEYELYSPNALGPEALGPNILDPDTPRPVGFMGCNWPQIEMLFVEPDCFGLGIGKMFLDHARQRAMVEDATLTLDVNEQNPAALAFYEHMGFQVYKRTDLDEQGNPYPLLYMSLNI